MENIIWQTFTFLKFVESRFWLPKDNKIFLNTCIQMTDIIIIIIIHIIIIIVVSNCYVVVAVIHFVYLGLFTPVVTGLK